MDKDLKPMPDVLYVDEPIEQHNGDLLYEGRASRFHARHKYIRETEPQAVDVDVDGYLKQLDELGNRHVKGKEDEPDILRDEIHRLTNLIRNLIRGAIPDDMVLVPRGNDYDCAMRLIDKMGWSEINEFHEQLKKGQCIREDAGGYFIRCVKALFGYKNTDPVLTYKNAAKAMINAYSDLCKGDKP